MIFGKALRLAWITLLGVGALSAGPVVAQERGRGGEFKIGKWVGYIKIDGANEAVATTMDVFDTSPEDIREFPRRNALFKMVLGGYNGTEYESEWFKDLQYDFNQGILTLDEPTNDLLITAVVFTEPRIQLEGQVWIRSAAVSGSIFLEFQDDEPEDASHRGIDLPPPKLMTGLAGQYEGVCGAQRAVLQLMTARGLQGTASEGGGLDDYAIMGTLGLEDTSLCQGLNLPGRPIWCVNRHFSSGTYNFFNGALSLSSNIGSEACQILEGKVSCRIRVAQTNVDCRLNKTDKTTTPFTAFPRRYSVAATAEQRQPLPQPAPPASTALVTALRGTYYGYLHHEATDRYQPIRLNVIATTSTENPHIENNVYVSVTAIAHFGGTLSTDFWPQQYNRRSSYFRPGYVWEAPDTDAFLQPKDWRQGFVSGDWFSKQFGRVGTFQVVKSGALPVLNSQAKLVQSIAGEFRGPRDRAGGFVDQWWARHLVPLQPRLSRANFVTFGGEYQMWTDEIAWPRRQIGHGTYEMYSGAVAWMSDEDGTHRLVTGMLDSRPDKIRLFWPGAFSWGVGIFDYELNTYARLAI